MRGVLEAPVLRTKTRVEDYHALALPNLLQDVVGHLGCAI